MAEERAVVEAEAVDEEKFSITKMNKVSQMTLSIIQKCHIQTRMHSPTQLNLRLTTHMSFLRQHTIQLKLRVHSSAQVLPQTPHTTIEVQAQNSANEFTEFTEDITNDVLRLVEIGETDLQQVLNQKDIMQLNDTDFQQLDTLMNDGTNVALNDNIYLINRDEKGDQYLIPVRVQNQIYNVLI